jgi:hypothetical protein
VLSDDRILGSGKFVQRVIKEAGAKSKEAGPRGPGFPGLIIPQKRLRPKYDESYRFNHVEKTLLAAIWPCPFHVFVSQSGNINEFRQSVRSYDFTRSSWRLFLTIWR